MKQNWLTIKWLKFGKHAEDFGLVVLFSTYWIGLFNIWVLKHQMLQFREATDAIESVKALRRKYTNIEGQYQHINWRLINNHRNMELNNCFTCSWQCWLTTHDYVLIFHKMAATSSCVNKIHLHIYFGTMATDWLILTACQLI